MAFNFDSFLSGLQDAAPAALAGGLAYGAVQQGRNLNEGLTNLGEDLATNTAFIPYGVTAGNLGSTQVGPGGTTTLSGSAVDTAGSFGRGTYGQGINMLRGASGNPQLDGALYQLNLAGQGIPSGNPMFNDATSMLGAAGSMGAATNEAYPGAQSRLNAARAGLRDPQADALAAASGLIDQSTQDMSARQQELFEQQMAIANPELNRQRANMEAMSYARGRGGLSGSQYGGSGEQFAQSRAEAEARNAAAFQAQSLAMQEQAQQGQLASQFGALGDRLANTQAGMAGLRNSMGLQNAQLAQQGAGLLGNLAQTSSNVGATDAQIAQNRSQMLAEMANLRNTFGLTDAQLAQSAGSDLGRLGLAGYESSFMPFQNLLAASELGLRNADVAQTGQLTGQNLLGQLASIGMQGEVNSYQAAANLLGSLVGSQSATDGLFSGIGDLLGSISSGNPPPGTIFGNSPVSSFNPTLDFGPYPY